VKLLILSASMLLGLPVFSYENGWQEMSDLLPPNPLIFDIGANVGGKTQRYLSLNPLAVVCVEPIPDCVNFLQEHFKSHPNVFIVPACASYYLGEIKFFLSDQYSYLSTADEAWKSGRFKNYTWNRSIIVPTTTIDELVLRYGVPDFCKIDVEGYELNVLRGMSKPIPYLSFEFTAEFLDEKTLPCMEYLYSLGYRSFNVAILETEAFNGTGKWVSKKTLYTYLKNHPDSLCWGDIYARFNK
jgi:FkbM family methyltransferase